MLEAYVIFFMSTILAIIGFFIHRFFKSVDEIKKSLDAIKITLATREENMRQVREDVHEMRLRQQDYNKRLYEIELQLAKNKQS